VYAWGNNEFGQLGITETIKNEIEYKPKLISAFNGLKVISCSTGATHSLFVT